MTGQDGGFRAAAARFKNEVEAALTRARRAAAEAKEQSADFRRGSDDLANQARTGRLRIRRSQVQPTSEQAREDAEKFRNANNLPVEQLPDADELTRRTAPPAEAPPPQRDDEDFSQRQLLIDIDARDELAPTPSVPPVDQTSDESARPRIDSPARARDDNDDFSQQRILFDATVETYRPDPGSNPGFESSDEENRS
jgi:hypothetical protein